MTPGLFWLGLIVGALPLAAWAGEVTNRVVISVEGNYRVIHANGIPDHATGHFPNRNNPNAIAEKDYTFRVPLKP